MNDGRRVAEVFGGSVGVEAQRLPSGPGPASAGPDGPPGWELSEAVGDLLFPARRPVSGIRAVGRVTAC
ncbi:MAG: hypothetical protein GY925_15325 [Actinomycetia bacterium]|nr:hypothetical protein [Actinomycetes bacterium]